MDSLDTVYSSQWEMTTWLLTKRMQSLIDSWVPWTKSQLAEWSLHLPQKPLLKSLILSKSQRLSASRWEDLTLLCWTFPNSHVTSKKHPRWSMPWNIPIASPSISRHSLWSLPQWPGVDHQRAPTGTKILNSRRECPSPSTKPWSKWNWLPWPFKSKTACYEFTSFALGSCTVTESRMTSSMSSSAELGFRYTLTLQLFQWSLGDKTCCQRSMWVIWLALLTCS